MVDFDEEDEHDGEDDGRVEVGHVERGAERADERVREHDGDHHGRGELDAEALHETRHHRRAACHSKCAQIQKPHIEFSGHFELT